MSVTVVGSIAFDAVKTPWGQRDRLLGGSAVHFALSASFLADVRVVGPVGDDFGEDEYDVLRARGVNVDDIEHVAGGKTFFWSGEYEYDLNDRHTLRHAAQRLRGLRAQALGRLQGAPTSSSWPTSSPTCSARCASSARARALSAWTR